MVVKKIQVTKKQPFKRWLKIEATKESKAILIPQQPSGKFRLFYQGKEYPKPDKNRAAEHFLKLLGFEQKEDTKTHNVSISSLCGISVACKPLKDAPIIMVSIGAESEVGLVKNAKMITEHLNEYAPNAAVFAIDRNKHKMCRGES
jgi:hypothetical protein